MRGRWRRRRASEGRQPKAAGVRLLTLVEGGLPRRAVLSGRGEDTRGMRGRRAVGGDTAFLCRREVGGSSVRGSPAAPRMGRQQAGTGVGRRRAAVRAVEGGLGGEGSGGRWQDPRGAGRQMGGARRRQMGHLFTCQAADTTNHILPPSDWVGAAPATWRHLWREREGVRQSRRNGGRTRGAFPILLVGRRSGTSICIEVTPVCCGHHGHGRALCYFGQRLRTQPRAPQPQPRLHPPGFYGRGVA